MRRRALRVMPPAKEKNRRRRVLAVASDWPRARRPVQRARLWAKTWTASQALFGKLRIGGEASRGEMVEPHAVLQVPDGVLDFGVGRGAGGSIILLLWRGYHRWRGDSEYREGRGNLFGGLPPLARGELGPNWT